MMHKIKSFRTTLPAIAGLLFICSGTASAGLMQVDFSGTVLTADSGNNLGLSVNNTVTGYTIFEGSLLSGIGFESIGLGSAGNGFGGLLTMNMGTTSYFASDDIFFSDDIFPELLFTGGALTGFDFLIDNKPTVGDEFSVFGVQWDIFSLNDTRVTGIWDTFADPFVVNAPVQVPEPSTLSLLGLAGLALLARRLKVA